MYSSSFYKIDLDHVSFCQIICFFTTSRGHPQSLASAKRRPLIKIAVTLALGGSESRRPSTIFIEKTDLGENRLLPITIRERFSQITDEDLRLLNYNVDTARPEWFILQALPVPPVTLSLIHI